MIVDFDPLGIIPGSGSAHGAVDRRQTWSKVRDAVDDTYRRNGGIKDRISSVASGSSSEHEMLTKLASGIRRLDMIEEEWRDIYSAIFDECMNGTISIPESETSKIEKDVHRTFSLFTRSIPNLRLKMSIDEYYESLHSVLVAATHECGYCQGINFLAALFLLGEKDERDSFILLCFLLKNRHLKILYDPKCSSLLEYMNTFSKRFRKCNKTVYQHLKNTGFSPVCYSIEWFTTCFIVSHPGELSVCVVDLLIMGFDDIMIRVGLAMMDLLHDEILALDAEQLQSNFKKIAMALDPVDVLSKALTGDYVNPHCPNVLQVRLLVEVNSSCILNIFQTLMFIIFLLSPHCSRCITDDVSKY
jgi:Rab-GTPase-TBC domain